MITTRLGTKLASVLLLLAATALPVKAWAAATVVTSIRPVQALVYAVMGEIGIPEVLMEPGASPHAYALKPSQMETLADADIVFWIGPGLESALEGPLAGLDADVRVVNLLDAPGLELLHYDERGGDHGEGHAHGAVDPHVWLSPRNNLAIYDYIAAELTRLSPGNGDIYAKNLRVAKNRMKLLERQAKKMLAPVLNEPYMVQHDGYGYLARDFGLNEVGHLQTLPGREPGARHVADIRKAIAEHGVKCLFHEPQFTPALAQQLARETGVHLAEIDPMGSELDFSETLSVRIIQYVTLAMTNCLYTPPEAEQEAEQNAPPGGERK